MMTNNYKKVIRSYNFAEEEFKFLPSEIVNVDEKKLSPMDRAILEGIKFQITVSKANSVYQNIKNVINIHDSQFTIRKLINHQTLTFTVGGASFAIAAFFLLSLTYYANVNLHLGMNFLTDLFA